ncbi:MAG TPA: hemin uptake protein HemP [Planctomycetota bacterium]|nr:hemin uptake protein HemP [Planctomycetota bacterium]
MISNKERPAAAAAPVERKRVTSAELLRGERQILILHAGQEYRLQVTKNDKLILTK